MNKDTIQGKWHELKGKVIEKWGKLTDDELTRIEGKQEELLGLIQKRYGYKREQAEKEVQDFVEKNCK